jgi:hypothetical protein
MFILLTISFMFVLISSSVSGTFFIEKRESSTLSNSDPQDLLIITPAEPDGENGWYISEPIISINLDLPISEIYYKIDSGCWMAYTEPFTQTWSDGNHIIEAKAIHCSFGEIYDSIEFKIDTTSPEIFTPEIFQCPFSIEAVALDQTSGMNKFDFYLDRCYKHTDTDEPYTWNPDSDEIHGRFHKIKIIAYDNAGNSKSDIVKVWIIQSKIINLRPIFQKNIFQFLFSNLF